MRVFNLTVQLSILNTVEMEENQEDKRLEQLDKESSKPLTQNIPSVQENESNTERQDSEEGEIKTTSQRRPQFRFSENNRRLFS